HVGWLVNDVETFEVNPHGVGGIRDPPVSERVGCQQVTELVVKTRLGNAENGDQRDAQQQNQESYRQDGQAATDGEAAEGLLNAQDRGRRLWILPAQYDEHSRKGEQELDYG